jgi:hypothetical protein
LPLATCFKEAAVKKFERVQEMVSAWPDPDYLKKREAGGWRLVAIEWEREVVPEIPKKQEPRTGKSLEEIPYGTRIASDCLHLEEDPSEMEVLKFLAELIVQDASFTAMAEALNRQPFRTRDGNPWTAVGVFQLTPRLIEVAPRILSGNEWESRKKHLPRVAWNS